MAARHEAGSRSPISRDVGVLFRERLFQPSEYELHVDGTVISARGCSAWSLKNRWGYDWTWLDGSACRVRFESIYENSQLFVNDELKYETPPYHGAQKDGWRVFWRRADDKSRVLIVDGDQEFLKPVKYRFLNPQGGLVARFEWEGGRQRGRKEAVPSPLRDFSASDEELRLIWAFLLAKEGSEAPENG